MFHSTPTIYQQNNLSTEQSTDTQQATTLTPATKAQLLNRLISPYFQETINWWQGHIKHNNISTRSCGLTLFQPFPYTTPAEKEEHYETDKEGKYLPGIAGAWKTWKRQKRKHSISTYRYSFVPSLNIVNM